jgi:hypothetical protein
MKYALERVDKNLFKLPIIKSPILSYIPPYSPLKVTRHIGEIFRLHLQLGRVSSVSNQPEAKMEICFSETSIDFHRTTRRYTPEDIILHNHRNKNLKYNIPFVRFYGNILNSSQVFSCVKRTDGRSDSNSRSTAI